MFINADTDQNKDVAKKNHINSVKKHIKRLSSTEYRSLYGNSSLDLVIMFMNVEGAYILACDNDLIREALKNNRIVNVSVFMFAKLCIKFAKLSSQNKTSFTYRQASKTLFKI